MAASARERHSLILSHLQSEVNQTFIDHSYATVSIPVTCAATYRYYSCTDIHYIHHSRRVKIQELFNDRLNNCHKYLISDYPVAKFEYETMLKVIKCLDQYEEVRHA